MIRAEIILDSMLWKKKIKNVNFFFNNLLKNFPKNYQFKKKRVSFTILLSNNNYIKKLNKKFRKKNKPTDVLSFPFENKLEVKKEIYLGDIIISYEFINNPKFLKKIEFKKKLAKTFIHGFLHLLNYDHLKIKDYIKMNKEEIKIYNLVSKKIEKFI